MIHTRAARSSSRARRRAPTSTCGRSTSPITSVCSARGLDLGGKDRRSVPTDARLAAVAAGASDPDLVALYFQYGPLSADRQLAAGRSARQPAGHLERRAAAPVERATTTSTSTPQMNYWPAEVTNLAECARAAVRPDRVHARARAADGARPLRRARLGGPPQSPTLGRSPSPGERRVVGPLADAARPGSAQHLWEHYAFGRDREFLRAAPIRS